MAVKNPLDFWRSESWSPARELTSLQRGIDRLFEDFLGPISEQSEEVGYNPPVDIDETDSHYLLNFDLPGVPQDHIRIEVADNQLRVSGERKLERMEGKGRSRRMERFYGSFSRSFLLPAGVDPSKIEASYDSGVLQLSLPKSEAGRAREIPIQERKMLSKEEKAVEKGKKAA